MQLTGPRLGLSPGEGMSSSEKPVGIERKLVVELWFGTCPSRTLVPCFGSPAP